MGARSNLATRIYHRDTKHHGAGELPALPSHRSLTAGQIDGVLSFQWQNVPFCRAFLLPLISLLGAKYMKELCWCCSKRHGTSMYAGRVQQETKDICTERYIVQALVWWLCFERHLQGFPDGPFKAEFLLQWRAKPFCKFWARNIVSCSVAPRPI